MTAVLGKKEIMDGMDPGTEVEFCVDSLLPVRTLQVTSAKINENGRLEVCIGGESCMEYPADFLKLHCQCKECFNPVCLSYTNLYGDISPENFKLSSVETLQNGEIVKCVYADGHESEFRCDWLYNRRMTEEGKKEREKHLTMYNPIPWPQASEMVVQRVTYQQVTETSHGFVTFGDAMTKHGICIITDSPDRLVSHEFADKTGLFLLNNHYGMNFHVRNEPKPTNHAYTTVALGLHIDQPFLQSTPDIQFLHCLVQSETGGENVMSDSIRAANILKEKHPDYFKILTKMKVHHTDVIAHNGGVQCLLSNSVPVINLDSQGEPIFIQWNNATKSGFFEGNAEDYESHAQAMRSFWKILYECSIDIKSQPGDILVFDNKRVMHGRKAYDSSQERELEGWYTQWEWLYSKLRISRIKGAKATEVNN